MRVCDACEYVYVYYMFLVRMHFFLDLCVCICMYAYWRTEASCCCYHIDAILDIAGTGGVTLLNLQEAEWELALVEDQLEVIPWKQEEEHQLDSLVESSKAES